MGCFVCNHQCGRLWQSKHGVFQVLPDLTFCDAISSPWLWTPFSSSTAGRSCTEMYSTCSCWCGCHISNHFLYPWLKTPSTSSSLIGGWVCMPEMLWCQIMDSFYLTLVLNCIEMPGERWQDHLFNPLTISEWLALFLTGDWAVT